MSGRIQGGLDLMKIKKVEFEYVYKKMGELKTGDEVLGPGGEKHKILEIYEQGQQDLYKITLSDGRSFEAGLDHLTTVHFRNSHVRPDKKVYDTLTTKYIMDNLDKYLFEIPTDETFSWNELDYPQFLEMLPCHEYDPIDEEYIKPDLTRDSNKVYIEKIEKIPEQKNCRCIALDYPWGLYLTEDGILTHNSLLTNLCMSYIITHFCLMREPYKVLGHSQPVYEKVKLPNGKYTTIGDLKIGQEIAGVLKDTSKIIDIYDQGEKETYELTFDDNTTCKCSLDHYWTVYDFFNQNYIVLKTKDIINNVDRYGFPDLEDCKRDREAILAAEQYFENTNYQRIDLDIDQVILEVSMLQKILFSEDIKGVYNRESFYKKYQREIDTIYENSKGRISKRKHSYFYDNQYFDSSDELTFYVYRKLYDTPVKRNVANNINSFYVEYEANGKKHKAFPDFVDEQSNYYEIKGKHLLDENGNFINPFTTDSSILEVFKQKGEALKKAKVIILDSNKIKCMQRVLLREKQIDTTSKSPYRKDLTKKEYIQFLWDIYKKDHKMDYNPNRACSKPIFNTFKQDLPIKFEDIPSIEKTCDRIWGRQRVSCTCKSCGTFFEKTYITLKNHEMLELCKSCLQKHVAQNRSQEVKDLRSKKLSEKLKAVRQTKNDEIVAKRNATIVERYGSKENLVKIVTEKARATNYEKYGIASLTAAMNLKNKEKQNCEKTC